MLEFEHGRIRFYEGQGMVATCLRHGRHCRMTRQVTASRVAGREGQGRPLGMLAAWVARGTLPEFDSMELHVGMVKYGPLPDHEERRLARESLAGLPDLDWFLGMERPRRDDEEDEEPAIVP